MGNEPLYHVTILSNFARAFDKYSRTYAKRHIEESRFADRFFLLRRDELSIGITKARALLDKTRIAGDRMLVLQTHAADGELFPNDRTGLGRYIKRDWVNVDQVHFVDGTGGLAATRIEEAVADSLRLLTPLMEPYEELRPRSVSILPIAIGCQAACPFCFSKASVSVDQATRRFDIHRVRDVVIRAEKLGARRGVITGGGEPGLLPFERLVELVQECSRVLPKVVLITNGYFLDVLAEAERADALKALADAGLSVLSISCHHHDAETNAAIMQLNTRCDRIATTWSQHRQTLNGLRLRWVCVLQAGGVDSTQSIANYLDWTTSLNVTEVCFKELYVSTSQESVYHDHVANEWSYRHQVPLQTLIHFADAHHWQIIQRLPWGAPIFRGNWRGHAVQVAAYTEPSLYWERSHGIVRSWNLMADGQCLASLEDRQSEVC